MSVSAGVSGGFSGGVSGSLSAGGAAGFSAGLGAGSSAGQGTATLTPYDHDGKQASGDPIVVDFNPASLRLQHQARGPAAKAGEPKADVTGSGSTLSMDLLFDTTRTGTDARVKPERLLAVLRQSDQTNPKGSAKLRFAWGGFAFLGVLSSLGETVDLFSDVGVPLRSTVALILSRFESSPSPVSTGSSFGSISAGVSAGASAGISGGLSAGASFSAGASLSGGAVLGASAALSSGATVGSTPLVQITAGDTLQGLVSRSGGISWQAVARANGIENPRLMPPGAVLDLRAGG